MKRLYVRQIVLHQGRIFSKEDLGPCDCLPYVSMRSRGKSYSACSRALVKTFRRLPCTWSQTPAPMLRSGLLKGLAGRLPQTRPTHRSRSGHPALLSLNMKPQAPMQAIQKTWPKAQAHLATPRAVSNAFLLRSQLQPPRRPQPEDLQADLIVLEPIINGKAWAKPYKQGHRAAYDRLQAGVGSSGAVSKVEGFLGVCRTVVETSGS